MVPWPVVLSMLTSMAAYSQITTAQAVSTAAATSGAAGAAATAAATNPRLLVDIVQLPLRLINAPFYYLLGGAEADRRLRALELADAHLAEAQRAFVDLLK